MKPSLDIIIVNWNAGNLLRDCLSSVLNSIREVFVLSRVVVVDNASTDASIEKLDSLGLPLIIIRNARNRGFAAACNQGVEGSKADYLLFLNPDTRLFEDSLIKPLSFMEQPENQQIGIVGIQLVDEIGHVARTCARFPTPRMLFSEIFGLERLFPRYLPAHFMREWDHSETCEVDHIMGAFFMIRRHLFETLGGFDERFFVYIEDVDLSYRANNAGWKTVYLADAQAYHKGGGTSEQVKSTRLFYSLRSRLLYGFKHFPLWQAWALTGVTCLVEPFTRTLYCLARGDRAGVRNTWKAYLMLWRDIGRIVRGEVRLHP